MLTLISWRSCRVGSSEKALNFLGSVTLEKRRESYVRNPVEKCSSNYWPHFCMHYFNYNKDVLPGRTKSSGKLRLPSIKLECAKNSFFFIMVVYFSIRFRFERGGSRGRVAPPLWEVFELVWLPMLSGYPFSYKNNIMSYDISSSPIYQYKKKVAIPLLDSLIIQMQDRFLTKIAMPAICFV